MTILVTGASGQLGRLVLMSLIEHGVSPLDLRAGARRHETLTELAARGVDVVHLDYDDPASVAGAVNGVRRVLLVSGSEVGKRVQQHLTIVDAAAAAGVEMAVYTSAPKADRTTLVLAPEHKATEELIRASGVPFVVLRNNWYTENYAAALASAARTGTLVTSAGEGRVASATRADYAEAAAVVIAGEGHSGRVYELGGDAAWRFEELAAAFSEVLGRPVALEQLTREDHAARLVEQGVDPARAAFVTALEANIAMGELADTDGTLGRLIGRPTTTLVPGLRPLV